jgi:hypothetical protein
MSHKRKRSGADADAAADDTAAHDNRAAAAAASMSHKRKRSGADDDAYDAFGVTSIPRHLLEDLVIMTL